MTSRGANCRSGTFGWRRTAGYFLLLCAIACSLGSSASGQNKPAPPPISDLERQNLGRVSARTTQLIAIFHRDPGLLVELKRLVAKEATAHGQIVADADLTDEAIFARLDLDVGFRSQATLLVQKYGYLLPELNPDSALAREEGLRMQERARLEAQLQAQALDRARQSVTGAAPTQRCDETNSTSAECIAQNSANVGQRSNPLTPTSGIRGTVPGGVNGEQPENLAAPESGTPLSDLQIQEMEESGQLEQQQSGLQGRAYNQNAFGELQSQSGQTSSLQSQSNQMTLGTGTQGQRQALTGATQMQGTQGEEMEGIEEPLLARERPPLGTTDVEYDPYSNTYGNTSGSQILNITPLNPYVPGYSRPRETVSSSQKLFLRANPYENIPSLYDMYLQASPQPATPERFGMQIFKYGTRDLRKIPMDLPAGPDYVVGPGDGLTIDMWGGVTRHFYRVVDREGRITLPEVEPMLVSGKSLADVQELLQQTLRKQFRNVSADISLSRLRTVRVYVVGDVLHPGAYDISSLSTPLNALFAAGGPTIRGSLRTLKHYRGDQLLEDVDTYDLLLHGVKGDMQRLENGDSVMVPPIGPEITVEGMVRRPAIYEQKDEKDLSQLLALAGGLLPTATLRHVEVQRLIAHEKQTMLSLDIPGAEGTAEINAKLDSFAVQDGDRVRIFPIDAGNEDAIYLEGHVVRPGKYSFHEGMRLTDLISSYKDLLPEPAAAYGEIIRLSQPDFRPQVQSFNLTAALADPANAPLLKARDTVRIFGRYDFENAPTVSVWGDVRKPGTYRVSGDVHLSDAIHLAGGLEPDADTEDAQVFRYLSDSNLRIFSVKLASALEGSPSENIVLSSRDRVLVHSNSAASQPSSVYIKGDVARPGRYPLAGNMRVADLIRAAGGLQESADTQSADLTHYAWKGEKQIVGEQQQIPLAAALAENNSDQNVELHNGDVLAIRQRPGWNDLGASITLRGEVVHPGTYGIGPGERLSSVIRRAGGFSPNAYAYGSVLTRLEVQQLEEKSYSDTIQRVREQETALKLASAATSDPDEKLSDESAYTQWRATLDSLINNPPSGRVTIQVSSNLKSWANTSRDISVRAGDVLVVPKKPSYVIVQGQVYGPSAIAYRPGKSARWYLQQGGGPTNLANKRAIFVIRADGTVIGGHSYLWSNQLEATLQPGDMVIVPEKPLGGPPIWRTILQNAQILSSLTTSAILAAAY
jgi:polysaccharide biosynthesis/export protein